jgi:hypothetical protein
MGVFGLRGCPTFSTAVRLHLHSHIQGSHEGSPPIEFDRSGKTVKACASLLSLGEANSGTIVIKWSPKGQGNSLGSFAMPLSEQAVALGGLVEQGPFAEAAISGSVTQSYTGGATCGVAEGKKKAKKVDKGTLTGSLTV